MICPYNLSVHFTVVQTTHSDEVSETESVHARTSGVVPLDLVVSKKRSMLDWLEET